MRPTPCMKLLLVLFVIGWVAGSVGCNRQVYPKSDYGQINLSEARFSPDGFSVFRALCDDTDRRAIEIRSLSPKTASKIDTLVWTQHQYSAHSDDVIKWTEDWLSRGGKSLIYVGRDYSPMSDYWQLCALEKIRANADPNEIESMRVSEAFEMAELNLIQLRARSKIVLPWGVQEIVRTPWTESKSPKGKFAAAISSQSTGRWKVRSKFEGWDEVDIPAFVKSLAQNTVVSVGNALPAGAVPPNPAVAPVPAQPASPVLTPAPKGPNVGILLPDDKSFLDQARKAESWTDYSSEVLLATEDGTPLITCVQRDKWLGSKVYLLANASLVSNLSLTFSANREVAKELIDQLPAGKVGYMSMSVDPSVYEGNESDQQKGFEALTMWPLNVITIHASFMGIIVLLALFPIFGRPRKLPQLSTQNFAQHIEAMAALLHKSRDRFYALATIADYFRTVRRDPKSEWANCEVDVNSTPVSPFAASPPTSKTPAP